MTVPRSYHTATPLKDGRILVVGGTPGIVSCEIFDPASSTWTITGDLNQERYAHTATLLDDGRVLVAGGNPGRWDATQTANCEIFDPATGVWTSTASLSFPRRNHSATLLPDGKVLVTGGETNDLGLVCLAQVEIFDPEPGAWAELRPMLYRHGGHTATLLKDGRVLVVGGNPYGPNAHGAEIYSPISDQWEPAGQTAIYRAYHSATLLDDGRVLIAGGYFFEGAKTAKVELFDTATCTWIEAPDMASARARQTATRLESDGILFSGGVQDAPAAKAELYSPSSGVLETIDFPALDREEHSATLLPWDRVIIAGGGKAFLFNPTTDCIWIDCLELPGDCDGDGSVSIGEVQRAINMFLGAAAPDCGADCNGDGKVSIGEVQKVINAFLGLPASC